MLRFVVPVFEQAFQSSFACPGQHGRIRDPYVLYVAATEVLRSLSETSEIILFLLVQSGRHLCLSAYSFREERFQA